MRAIDRTDLVADVEKGTAHLTIRLVEQGKKLPFRVLVTHEGPTIGKTHGTLAAVDTEAEGREQYEFHVGQAGEKGWSAALPRGVRLWAGVPDPSGEIAEGVTVPPPDVRRGGRQKGGPRKRVA